MYDVAVIGGGPAGSQVAYRMAGMGYKVVVIEQKERIDEPVCCTGIISQECVKSFSIDESVIYRWANSASIISPSGKIFKMKRSKPLACIVNRTALNEFLAARAVNEGAEYLLNRKVCSIKVEKDYVTTNINEEVGETTFLKSRAVVIASGSNIEPVEGLNRVRYSDAVAGVQEEVTTYSVEEVEIYLGSGVAPGFFAWLVPTSPQKAIAGLMSRSKSVDYFKKFIRYLETRNKVISNESKLSYGRIPIKPLNKTYGERMLVVGSAAGQVKPTTGGGIYYGLLCADIAADNLSRLLKNNTLSVKNLARYEKEWKEKLEKELKVGYWARMLYEKLSDERLDKILDLIQSKGIDRVLLESEDLSFDWHSGSVIKLIRNQAFNKIVDTIKIPFPYFNYDMDR